MNTNFKEHLGSEIKELMPYNIYVDVELKSINKSGIDIKFLLDRMMILPYTRIERKIYRS